MTQARVCMEDAEKGSRKARERQEKALTQRERRRRRGRREELVARLKTLSTLDLAGVGSSLSFLR
jgi:hypothetical protein